jgi:hypothetical protein
MARLESQAKMGTFPLDDWRVDQLGNLLKNTRSQNGSVVGKILDPFADTGETIKKLADKWNMEPFAVELKEEAAREAQELLGVSNAIWADSYNGVVMSNNHFDVLYLNPPYDSDFSEMESRRSEYKALRHHWKYLRFGGVVIWVAYKNHITEKVARFLMENCKAVFPFYWAEPHLGQYTQVCLIGIKKDNDKDEPFSPNYTEHAVQHLKGVGSRIVDDNIPIEESRFIEMSEGITQENFKQPLCQYKYIVGHRTIRNKKTGETKKVIDSRIAIYGTEADNLQFRRKEADIPLLEKMHEGHGVHRLEGFDNFFRISVIEEQNDTPIAKPRTGQLGLIIAAGMINQTTLMHNDQLCMIRGSVRQKEFTASVQDEMDKNNNPTTVTTVHRMPTPVVTILYEDGTVENLTEEDALVNFIGEHMNQLLEIYERKYKPSYDMKIHPEWGKVFDQNKIKGKHEYLPTQEYYSVATAEQLMRQGKMVDVAEMSFGKTSCALAALEMMYRFERGKEAIQ